MVDVVDPAGLVRSQVVESADGALRLTLNGADNTRTIAGRFVAETFGSSVQHLAFASTTSSPLPRPCSGSASGRWRSRRTTTTTSKRGSASIPTLTERLRAANILYDRDEGGEFFQFYSQTFGEGFFFEIVERRGGYRGYGAPNAPFRIAAQKRALQAALSAA